MNFRNFDERGTFEIAMWKSRLKRHNWSLQFYSRQERMKKQKKNKTTRKAKTSNCIYVLWQSIVKGFVGRFTEEKESVSFEFRPGRVTLSKPASWYVALLWRHWLFWEHFSDAQSLALWTFSRNVTVFMKRSTASWTLNNSVKLKWKNDIIPILAIFANKPFG